MRKAERCVMAITGSIPTVSLSGILQLLCIEKKTGILKVRKGKAEYQVFLLEGYIVYAIQALKEARLGHLLIRDSIVSSDTVEVCLKIARSKKKTIGKILVDEGHISFATLEKYIYEQILEIFCHLFQWETGEFHYADSQYNIEWMVVVKLNTLQLVMETLQNIDDLYV